MTTKQLQRHLDFHWNQDCEEDEKLQAKHLKGLCDSSTSRIFVNKDLHKSEEDLHHTYFHELFHALLYAEGQTDHDEAVVDRFGGLLHQYETSKQGKQ